MAMRIGFEIEGAGLAGVGITMGYFAVEDTGARERQLFKLVHLGGEGPALVYGFVETLSPRGTWLPTQGDIGTVPPLITMSNRMIGITLESGWGYNIPATLAIEFGPYYGQSGDLVYKKENLVVWVSNIAMGKVEFRARLDRLPMKEVYFDTITGHLKRAKDIWKDVMERT